MSVISEGAGMSGAAVDGERLTISRYNRPRRCQLEGRCQGDLDAE